jgi:predicted TIM-barrel fold metal-dependent hydrolase
MTDLAQFISSAPIVDTHEHLHGEQTFLDTPFDILRDLFNNYVHSDMVVAGCGEDDLNALDTGSNNDIAARFRRVEPAWQRCKHTGYGEAVQIAAREVYGIEEITPEALEAKAGMGQLLHQPGTRLRLLRDQARLEQVQTDAFTEIVKLDDSGPEFFRYDISWAALSSGRPDPARLLEVTKVDVKDIETLNLAMQKVFDLYAEPAIAVKTQHAYERTLAWKKRAKTDASAVLARLLASVPLTEQDRLCLGDWCLARGVELATEHGIPIKIHTGYYAGHGSMYPDRIPAGQLAPLLREYPQARFILMHAAYPYCEELITLAKHFPNVTIDLCWAWSVNPFTACDVVRRFIHSVPSQKLFGFGGDTSFPTMALAYSIQARRWLTRALQQEVDEAYLSERQAIELAARFMHGNQREFFDLAVPLSPGRGGRG